MNLQQQRMAAAASSGFSAIMWITEDPARYLAFCSWAEAKSGQSFGIADLPQIIGDGRLLWTLADTLEQQ